MDNAHIEMIRQAGLRPAHVEVTGYAPECDGEPEILTGVYDAASFPAFLFVERTGPEEALAHLSAAAPALHGPCLGEMERERLNAESGSENAPGQQAVIEMLRGAQPAADAPDTSPQELELDPADIAEVEEPPAPLPQELIDAAGGDGWG